MRCVIYSRVSTDEQNTDNQIKELTEYAKRQEWSVVDIISDVCSGEKIGIGTGRLEKGVPTVATPLPYRLDSFY